MVARILLYIGSNLWKFSFPLAGRGILNAVLDLNDDSNNPTAYICLNNQIEVDFEECKFQENSFSGNVLLFQDTVKLDIKFKETQFSGSIHIGAQEISISGYQEAGEGVGIGFAIKNDEAEFQFPWPLPVVRIWPPSKNQPMLQQSKVLSLGLI